LGSKSGSIHAREKFIKHHLSAAEHKASDQAKNGDRPSVVTIYGKSRGLAHGDLSVQFFINSGLQEHLPFSSKAISDKYLYGYLAFMKEAAKLRSVGLKHVDLCTIWVGKHLDVIAFCEGTFMHHAVVI